MFCSNSLFSYLEQCFTFVFLCSYHNLMIIIWSYLIGVGILYKKKVKMHEMPFLREHAEQKAESPALQKKLI